MTVQRQPHKYSQQRIHSRRIAAAKQDGHPFDCSMTHCSFLTKESPPHHSACAILNFAENPSNEKRFLCANIQIEKPWLSPYAFLGSCARAPSDKLVLRFAGNLCQVG